MCFILLSRCVYRQGFFDFFVKSFLRFSYEADCTHAFPITDLFLNAYYQMFPKKINPICANCRFFAQAAIFPTYSISQREILRLRRVASVT